MKPSSAIKKMKTIGILGGMGPVSSAHFYSEILTVCQREYGAVEEWDFPPMFLYSLPVDESTNEGFNDLSAALVPLLPAVRTIEKAGADFLVIPCNTAHYFLKELQAEVNIPIISMIDHVMQEAKKQGRKKVGLMGTLTTVSTGLYLPSAKKYGVEIISIEGEECHQVCQVIGNVTSGRATATDTDCLRTIAETLVARGAESVILGCTELPLALTPKDTDIPLLDSVNILARASARYAYGKE
jgi:aspartate racemase